MKFLDKESKFSRVGKKYPELEIVKKKTLLKNHILQHYMMNMKMKIIMTCMKRMMLEQFMKLSVELAAIRYFQQKIVINY